MNKDERIAHLNHDIDILMEGKEPEQFSDTSNEYPEMMDLASQLRSAGYLHLSRGPEALRIHLNNLSKSQGFPPTPDKDILSTARSFSMQGITLAVLILIAVFIIIFLAFPPLRATADEILHRIGFLVIDNAPTHIEEIYQTPVPTLDPREPPDGPRSVYTYRTLTLDEVRKESGLQVYLPGYIPNDLYILGYRDVIKNGDRTIIETLYRNDNLEDRDFITISQSTFNQDQSSELFSVGDAPIQDVNVRGRSGVWIKQTNRGVTRNDDGSLQMFGINYLIWEEDGFIFRLESHHLPLDEMLRIAESLYKG